MITDDIFASMVAEEVKNKLPPSRRQELLKTENWDRWKRALLSLLENINAQVESLSLDQQADENRYKAMGSEGKKLAEMATAAYTHKLNKVNRFKFHVENRLVQVESMIAGNGSFEESPSQDVEFFKDAIREHRKLLNDFDLEPTSIDKALWATLDRKWEFDTIDPRSL